MKRRIYSLTVLLGLSGLACVEQPDRKVDTEQLISTEERFEQSTAAGNLLATALVEENGLDFALCAER